MKKKTKSTTTWERAREVPGKVGNGLLGAGRQAWLAGLGSAALASEQARDAFTALIERGEELEDRAAPRKRLDRAKTRVEKARRKIEEQTEKSMTSALHFVGMPTYRDINTLIDRVEVLTRRVESLGSR